MGAKTSRDEDGSSYNAASYQPTSSYSGNQYRNSPPQQSYSYPSQYEQNYPVQEAYPAYPPQHHPAPAPASPIPVAAAAPPAPAPDPGYGGPPHRPQNKFDRRYSTIADSYNSLEQEKPNMSTMESLKFLASSPYIRDLATLVVVYGISINLVEFPSPNEYSSFMGDFSTATGIATFTMMLLSQWIFNKYGWGVAAKITPTVLLLTGVGFFSLILFGDPLGPGLMKFGITPLLAAVYVGAMQNIFSKSAKYSLFDPCKEMAYIPLDEDTKVKGKAAIDVVCNPLGKSGGALIQQFMILTFGSLANSTPYLGGILLIIMVAWLGAAKSHDTQFTASRQEEELEKEMERSAVKIPIVSSNVDSNGSLGSDSTSNNSSTENSFPRNA